MNVSSRADMNDEITTLLRSGMSETKRTGKNVGFWCENATPLFSQIYKKYVDSTVDSYVYASHLMYFIHTVYAGDIDMCVEMAQIFVESQLCDMPYANDL